MCASTTSVVGSTCVIQATLPAHGGKDRVLCGAGASPVRVRVLLVARLAADVRRWVTKLENEGGDEANKKRRMTTTETREIVVDIPPPGDARERPFIVEIS